MRLSNHHLASQSTQASTFKPGAKRLTTAFRIAFYLIAAEHILQAHSLTATNASSALSLSRSDKMNTINRSPALQLLKTMNAC
jgi:hypothetical protein